MKAERLWVAGRVQGVGFRYSVKQLAAGYEVTGWVRNLPDGRVEVWLQGEENEVREMREAIFASHLKGFIKEWERRDESVDPTLRGFEIRL